MPSHSGRRRFLQSAAALGMLGAFRGLAPAYAQNVPGPGGVLHVGGDRVADLIIDRTPFGYGGQQQMAVTINGTVPGPILRFREGEIATLRVTNRLDEDTSIHWHGILLPSAMDGVPGVSFAGIRPGETFTYRFQVRQHGTYWYHSHSSLQEQLGMYGPIIMDPVKPDPVAYDREHVIVLADWTFRDPHRVLAVMKKQGGFFNFQQRTLGDFFRDAKKNGFRETLAEREMWGRMRMNPTDILDITGATYTYLVNGLSPDGNWTGIFRPGERVRLRIINSAAATNFNFRIPGLAMTVVQADGQNVHPVTVEEFQIAIAETYDVIVQPKAEQAYTVFAEAVDRSGYGRGTLAPRPGMSAPVPALRERPERTMVDMGMDMGSMDMSGMEHGAMKMEPMPGMDHGNSKAKPMPDMQHDGMQMDHGGMEKKPMPGMEHGGMKMDSMPGMESPINGRHGPDTHGPGNQMVAMVQRNRLGERGVGLENVEHRVLVYTDLKALEPSLDPRPPEREIEIHLTGNMEAFIWGMDGLKFSESGEPPKVRVGERVRITLVNDTMMEHPMHLHGVFMEIDNGADLAHKPRKHTINVKPAERLSFDFTYDEPGNFAFHCHILYHMEMGMFRFVNVSGQPERKLT
ncbi:MAG TPA: copper resistance protein CopA [Oxalobacteraceae bacterium]|nr:copper resistance protein CopA [Oxalobacteraceae bacterium]